MRWTNTASGSGSDPALPGDVVTVITGGLVADDISRGDNVISQIQGLTYTPTGTPAVGVAATQIQTLSSLAVSSYQMSPASTDSLDCPNTTYGDFDGITSLAVAVELRTTGAALSAAINKRVSLGNLGYELGMDGSARPQLRYQTTGGSATLITTSVINDNFWHVLLALWDVSTGLVHLATELQAVSSPLVAGSAVNGAPFKLGATGLPLLLAMGADILWAMTFRGPQLHGRDPRELCKQLFFGFNPQHPAGFGPTGTLTVDRIP